ncbi:Secreted protein [Paraburkholderia kururiensis]|uniref:hypothetical protein n=1 Tax=Paraburkholderia kururiensis TaxID=984307 RepID=UPI0039A518D2
MLQTQIALQMLLNAIARRPARPAATHVAAATTASPPPATKESKMPSEFDFLDKHYDKTDIPEVAAQSARERFGNYPVARTSTVIYGIDWETLVDSIIKAVDNYSYGAIFNTSAFAYLGQYNGAPQWNIVLTGLKYVNATIKVVGSTPTYTIEDYDNGTIVVNAQVSGSNPPMLGDIVHLQAAIGNYIGTVQLKN